MIDQPYASPGEAAPQAASDVNVLGQRAAATIVDVILLMAVAMVVFVVQTIIGYVLAAIGIEGVLLAAWTVFILLTNLAIVVFPVAYYVYFESRKGQTVGKMVSGIKVIREDTGEAPDMKAALIRTLLRIVDGLFAYLVGFLIASNSEKRQRLGDMAAHTLVVRK